MYAEKLLPHDLEAEEAVVGSLLIDGESFARVSPMLQPADSYRERNQLCFAAAMALFQRDEAIDQLTLAGELGRTGHLETAGGTAYLSHLVSVTPTSAHSKDYANVVYRTSTMRKLIQAAPSISTLGYDDTDDVEATLRRAEETLFDVRGADRTRGFIPLPQIYDHYLQDWVGVSDPLAEPVMPGYAELDEVLRGVQQSDMVILGAPPSLGKSTLALNVCLNAAKNGSTAGVFSLETSCEQLAQRDSGSIEQDADVVRFIHREDVYTTKEEWEQQYPGQPYRIVAKHRNGPTGNIQLEFRDNPVRFDSFARVPAY